LRVGLRFAVLILGGAACSGLGLNFREPDIQLDHAVVLQVGFDVEGSHLGDITYDNDFTVSENGTTTITLPLRFGWSGVGSAVRAALGYGDLPYTMKGQATLRLPGGLTTSVSFTHEGRAPLTRAGTVAIPGVGPS
jgi:hypothetical protein